MPGLVLSASLCASYMLSLLLLLAFVLQIGAVQLAIYLPNALYVNSSVSFCYPTVGACQCVQDIVSFIYSGGRLCVVFISCKKWNISVR